MKQPFQIFNTNIPKVAYWVLTFVAWLVFFQLNSEYHLFYLEQSQLFVPESVNLTSSYGVVDYLTGSYVQHFGVPFCGAFIMALFNTLTSMMATYLLTRISPSKIWCVLSQLLPATMTFVFFSHLYRMQGTTAMLLALFLMCILQFVRIYFLRLGLSFLLVPLLYYCAGPIAIFMAFCIVLVDIFRERSGKSLLDILLIPYSIFIGWCAFYFGIAGSMRTALFPDEYFNHLMSAPAMVYYPWLVMFALLCAAGIFRNVRIKSVWASRSVAVASVVLVLLVIWKGTALYGISHALPLKQITYYSQHDNWEKVFDVTKDNGSNYLYVAYRNLALSHAGVLADRIFEYPQVGPLGLLPNWDQSFTVSQLLSDIYYQIGDIAISQQMAFEGIMAQGNGGNPHLWKRLVETNLIFGYNEVAGKYIDMLSKTPHYSDWAEKYRPYLYSPDKIRENPLLMEKKKNVGGENHLSRVLGFDADIDNILKCNPGNKPAIEYLGCLYLLGKDLEGFQKMLDKYYGTESLPELPLSFQQAVIIINEGNPDKWKEYKLSDKVISQFEAFRKLFVEQRQSPYLQETVYRSFGKTYWFYFTFKK